jgi:hypothetical protein
MRFYFGIIEHSTGLTLGNVLHEDELKNFEEEMQKNKVEYKITEISEEVFMYIISIQEELKRYRKNEDIPKSIIESMDNEMLEIYNKENNTNLTKEDLLKKFNEDVLFKK